MNDDFVSCVLNHVMDWRVLYLTGLDKETEMPKIIHKTYTQDVGLRLQNVDSACWLLQVFT